MKQARKHRELVLVPPGEQTCAPKRRPYARLPPRDLWVTYRIERSQSRLPNWAGSPPRRRCSVLGLPYKAGSLQRPRTKRGV
eukprot:6187450-Prymnesium_polylepis.2